MGDILRTCLHCLTLHEGNVITRLKQSTLGTYKVGKGDESTSADFWLGLRPSWSKWTKKSIGSCQSWLYEPISERQRPDSLRISSPSVEQPSGSGF